MEVVTANSWLYTTLSGDAQVAAAVGTRIYAERVPDDAAFPVILFQLQNGQDLMPLGTARIFTELLYYVRGIALGSSYSAVATVADRIDALLHGATGTAGNGTIFACTRVRPVSLLETEAAKDGITREFRHLGGVYRLYVR